MHSSIDTLIKKLFSLKKSQSFICNINENTFVCGNQAKQIYYQVHIDHHEYSDLDSINGVCDFYSIASNVEYGIDFANPLRNTKGKTYQIYGTSTKKGFNIDEIYIEDFHTNKFEACFREEITNTELGKKLVSEFNRLLDEILSFNSNN